MTALHLAFGVLPSTAQCTPEKLVVEFPQADLDELRAALAASRVGPETFEGSQQDRKYGITTQWLRDAKAAWLNDFDWLARHL